MTDKVILFGDLLSQPTRAILWFLIYSKIPHELKIVAIAKMEQKSDEYTKINPFKKIPSIKYKDTTVIESHNILRYLATEFKLPQFYNYQDLNSRIQVDTYLDWHHMGLRRYSAALFFQKFIVPKFGREPSKDFIKDAEANLPRVFNEIETIFLKSGSNDYLIGSKPTIADFSCFCEIKQLYLLDFDFKPYPVLTSWMNRMEQLDGYQESMKILIRLKSKL